MKILQPQIKAAEFVRTLYHVTPEAGTVLDELLDPTAWAHVVKQLKPGTRIEVTPEDRSWYADLYVRSVTDTTAHVVALHHVVFDKPTPAEVEAPYEIKFAGGDKWRVTRKSDKVVVAKSLASREAAETWVAENGLV